jgi:hypothetical protein
MNAFLDMLKFIFWVIVAIFVGFTTGFWFTTSLDTYITTKENNILIKELCIKNEINADSVLNVTQNDTLNVKIDIKGE